MKKLPPKPVHRLRRIGQKKSSQKRAVKDLLKKTDIRIHEAAGFSVNIKSKKFAFSIGQVAKVAVPKPVQLSKKSYVQTTIVHNEPSTSQAASANTSTPPAASASTSTSPSDNAASDLKTPTKISKLFVEFFVTDPSEMSPSKFEDIVSKIDLNRSQSKPDSEESLPHNTHANISSPIKFQQISPTKLVSDIVESDIEPVHQSPVFIDLCEDSPSEVEARIAKNSNEISKPAEKSPQRLFQKRGRPLKKERASLELEISSTVNSIQKVVSITNESLDDSKTKKKHETAREKIVKIKPQVEKCSKSKEKKRKEVVREQTVNEVDDDCLVMEEICSIFHNKMSPGENSETQVIFSALGQFQSSTYV